MLLQVFRATYGKAQVWGQAPSFITAKYTTGDGQEKTSLLLTSGNARSRTCFVIWSWHVAVAHHFVLLCASCA